MRLVATPWGEASASAPPGAGSAMGGCQSPGLEVAVPGEHLQPVCLTSVQSSPSNISSEAAATQGMQGSIKSASRRKEASVSVFQQILDYIEIVYGYQDWQKVEECLEQPRYSCSGFTAGWDVLSNSLSEVGPCCGTLIAQPSTVPWAGHRQVTKATPSSSVSYSLQLP